MYFTQCFFHPIALVQQPHIEELHVEVAYSANAGYFFSHAGRWSKFLSVGFSWFGFFKALISNK